MLRAKGELTDEQLGTLVKRDRFDHLPVPPFHWCSEGNDYLLLGYADSVGRRCP